MLYGEDIVAPRENCLWFAGQFALGLDPLLIESHVEDRDRSTGDSPPA